MRILHVVTLVSRDGAYGGPVAVARMQAAGLARLGHDVALVAAWDGAGELAIPGVDVRLHRGRRIVPGMGFPGLVSPGSTLDVGRLVGRADIVHVHLARDLVTLPAAALAAASHTPLVLQTHGMVRHDLRLKSRVVDGLLTRRILGSASAQLVLTDEEQRDAPKVARRSIRTERLTNGVTVPAERSAWGDGEEPHVVFSARLHARKRPVVFVEMCAELVRRGVTARFSIYGPDEGQLVAVLQAIRDLGLVDTVIYRGPLEPAAVLKTLRTTHVYVLPSVDEPFPMSVLEAMSLAIPAVITRSNGLAVVLAGTGGAMVSGEAPNALADAASALLQSRSTWREASSAARETVATAFNADDVVERLDGIYRQLIPGTA